MELWDLGDDRKTIGVIHSVGKIKPTAIKRGWLLSGVIKSKAGGVKARLFPGSGFPLIENACDLPFLQRQRTQGKMEREKPDWSSNSRLEKNGYLPVSVISKLPLRRQSCLLLTSKCLLMTTNQLKRETERARKILKSQIVNHHNIWLGLIFLCGLILVYLHTCLKRNACIGIDTQKHVEMMTNTQWHGNWAWRCFLILPPFPVFPRDFSFLCHRVGGC